MTPSRPPAAGTTAGRKIKGRKRDVAVDTGGLLLAVVVTTASLQDRDGAFRITAALREAFSTITLVGSWKYCVVTQALVAAGRGEGYRVGCKTRHLLAWFTIRTD